MPKPFIRTLNAIRSTQNPRGQDIAEAIDDLTAAIAKLATSVPTPAPAATVTTTKILPAQANSGPGPTLGKPAGTGSGQPTTGYISTILTSSPNGPITGPTSPLIVATADTDLTTDPVGSVLTADGAGNVTGESSTFLFGLSSYSAGIEDSPSLVIAGSYEYAAGQYEEDFWMVQNAIGSGINGSSTLEILHSGTSGPLSVLLGLDPFTAKVSNSPSLVIAGSYEASSSGPAFAEDSWSIQDVIGSGINGSSTLQFKHTGSAGKATVALPSLSLSGILYDTLGRGGNNGQVLVSTGAGIEWENGGGGSGFEYVVTSQTSNYGASSGDDVWCFGTFIVTLPVLTTSQRVKVSNRGTGQITVVPASGNINGGVSLILARQYSSCEFSGDGTNIGVE